MNRGRKVLISDFDGTICMNGKVFLENDIEAVNRFQKNGHLFGVCSGRSLQHLLEATAGHFTYDFYLLVTGSMVADRDGNVLFEKNIAHSDILKVSGIIDPSLKRFGVQYDDTVMFYNCEDGKIRDWDPERFRNVSIRGMSEIFSPDNEKDAQKNTEVINRTFCDLSAFQNTCCIDIVAKGCSKGNGVYVFRRLYEPEHIYAIGDSFNDIPMLDAADTSFTFDRSPDEVKQHADHIVTCVQEAVDMIKEK